MARPQTSDGAELAAWVASLCHDATETRTGWLACCPAHDDTHPSLSIDSTDDRVLLICRSHGCTFDAICAALMLRPAELFCGATYGRGADKSPIIDTYDYTDEHGTLLFQVCRTLSKQFPQRRPDASKPGGWAWGIKGIRRVLYRLPEVLRAIARGQPIYITEGEKDANNVCALGLTCTCNPMGAGNWKDAAYAETLTDADCRLLPDHDTDGAAHMEHVARQLAPLARSVRIVPGIHTAREKSDVSDWLASGGGRAQLEASAERAALWAPAPRAFAASIPPPNGQEPTSQPPATLPFDADSFYTDTYNARALIRDHGANLRYCYPWKAWFLWSGTHWQRDTSGAVMRLAKATIKGLARLLPGLDDKQAIALLSHIKSSLSNTKLKAMVENAQSEDGMAVQPDEFDRDLWLLNCANGTIDLRTGTLRDARHSDLITRCLSVPYDPHATCPKWEAFLDRVMGGKQGLTAFLHRAVGYSLTGSTMEQCLFILHGPTKTGKSTFLARLRALLGPYGTQADMESFMHKERQEIRNDLADLAGARVVCAIESQEGRRLNENLIKQLTGGVDQVKARFLFEDYFTFTPQFKVFLGSNHKPVIKDNDQAIWERIRLVPFVVQIPPEERRKSFDAELQEEIAGILAWAVRGCLEWQRRGDLEPPPEVLMATEAYQQEMDVFGRFLSEKCVMLRQAQTRPTPLYEAYKAWCDENGERAEPMNAIGRKLVERGFEKKESHGAIYLGVGLRSQDQD